MKKQRKRQWTALLLALALLFGTAACAAKESPAAAGSGSADAAPESGGSAASDSAVRVFADDCGREVEIPADITAIVPSGPISQIILFAIAPDLFVGLASEFVDAARGLIPDAYFDLPYLGQLYGSANLNVEELAAVGPQLIVDVGEAKSSVVEDMDDLQAQTQIPSVHIEATLSTMGDCFRRLGTLLGREEKAEELAQFCERVYDRTLSILDRVGDNKVSALYVLGEDGLNVLAKGSYHAELIDLLTDNLAVVESPTGKGTGNEVTMEQIALWDPDFILFGPDSIYDTVSERDTWKELTAIRTGRYIETPEGPHSWMGTPPAVQRYLGLIWLTAQLYPEYCDYDVRAEVGEYYALFYGCELTDEQYDALTANALLYP